MHWLLLGRSITIDPSLMGSRVYYHRPSMFLVFKSFLDSVLFAIRGESKKHFVNEQKKIIAKLSILLDAYLYYVLYKESLAQLYFLTYS